MRIKFPLHNLPGFSLVPLIFSAGSSFTTRLFAQPPKEAAPSALRSDFANRLATMLPKGVSKTPIPLRLPGYAETLPVVSADGKRIAFSASQSSGPLAPMSVYVCDSHGDYAREVNVGLFHCFPKGFSPDGKFLLVSGIDYGSVYKGHDGRLLVKVSLNGQAAPVPLTPAGESHNDGDAAFSPDGKHVVFATSYLVNAAVGKPARPAAKPATRDDEGKFDEDWTYVCRSDGTQCHRLHRGSRGVWSPDGRRVAIEDNGSVYVCRADGSGVRRLHAGSQVSWSPDSRNLAFLQEQAIPQDSDMAPAALFVERLDGSSPARCLISSMRFRLHSGERPRSKFHPTDIGEIFAWRDNTSLFVNMPIALRVVRVHDGAVIAEGPDASLRSPTFGSRQVVFLRDDSTSNPPPTLMFVRPAVRDGK